MSNLDTLDGLLEEAKSCHHELGMVESLIRIAYLNGRTSVHEENITNIHKKLWDNASTSLQEVEIDNIQ